jgi:hypothetical protein
MPRTSRSSQRFARNTEKVTRSHKNAGSIEKEAAQSRRKRRSALDGAMLPHMLWRYAMRSLAAGDDQSAAPGM